ncbi:MAG: DUF1573 domain-containing protein [Chitinophagales bacterium]|nr:DUF1573 domain-containing protein [Chitinophagales bacterium]MDW8274257.1 DUF1573 domain-containing protein [Chitinophagales bacterium]
MRNAAIILSIAAVLFSSYLLVRLQQLSKDYELKFLSLEKKINELGSQSFLQNANSVQNQQLQQPPSTQPLTSIAFDRTEHNFGTINQGQKVKTKFRFTNTGKENLVIQNAIGSCGCTVPSYPKEPVAPGKSAELEVEFDSSGKEGEQTKTVTVEANTEPKQIILTIRANIKAPKPAS